MNILSLEILAQTVRESRTKQNLSLEEVGKLSAINECTLKRLEIGGYFPSLAQLQKLADTLAFSLVDVFIEKEPSSHSFHFLPDGLTEEQKKEIAPFIDMATAIRQQMLLRKMYDRQLKASALNGSFSLDVS